MSDIFHGSNVAAHQAIPAVIDGCDYVFDGHAILPIK
jgi:hypothetical protein